jgi:hypothetical protein
MSYERCLGKCVRERDPREVSPFRRRRSSLGRAHVCCSAVEVDGSAAAQAARPRRPAAGKSARLSQDGPRAEGGSPLRRRSAQLLLTCPGQQRRGQALLSSSSSELSGAPGRVEGGILVGRLATCRRATAMGDGGERADRRRRRSLALLLLLHNQHPLLLPVLSARRS